MTKPICNACLNQAPDKKVLSVKNFILPVLSGLLILAAWIALLKDETLSNIIGVVAVIVAGTPIIKCGIVQTVKTIRKLDISELNMGVLITIALLASLYIGEYIAAATVAFIMIVGMLLEDITLWKAHNAVSNIMSLVPDSATIRRQGQEITVPLAQVRPGDTVLVKTGERIPVDGILRHGQGSVNQAPITGESMPVNKNIKDEVFEGTLLVEGYLEVEATKTGQDSTLAKIAKLVEQSQNSKTKFQRVADRFA
ncbi:MAG: cation-translocating P-type ATPase, partial [Planctomycetes bacterium]|nr:cation-translocating P-type ATPase [Planctomycetota bacterium]